jgi:hypothetical protein
LGVVDVRPELLVDREQPPVGGQLDREVGPPLLGAPTADVPVLAPREQAQEGGEPVVPVVVAGQGEQGGLRARDRRLGQCRAVGPLHPALVGVAAGQRVDLIATHQQQPAAGQGGLAELELRLGHQVGHRVGGVEPVSQVGHVVEPDLAVLGVRVIEPPAVHRVLQLALVQVGAEQDRQQRAQTRAEQEQRGQPADRSLRLEAELLRVHAARPAGCHVLRPGVRGSMVGHVRQIRPGVRQNR